MRRKPLLGLLLVLLALGGVIGAKLMAEHQPLANQAQEISAGAKPIYNNSLTFKIAGTSGKTAYEMVLASDFRSAKINVSAESIGSEAYVRILNPSGQVIVSEQTAPENGENKFTDTSKSYSVQLGRNYIIELYGTGVQVLSNLTYAQATEFMPSGVTERYVITAKGIRKSGWSDADGEEALYKIFKKYIVNQIETYKTNLSDEVLNNKTLDVANKAQLVLAYNNLKGVDQAPYREFINHLRRGGVPEISYHGKREYSVGESVDFAKLVSVRDGEDGEYDAEQITIQSDIDFNQAGKYTLSYRASDSDRNTVTLKIPITIVEVVEPDVIPESPVVAPEPPVDNSDKKPSATDASSSQAPTVGGGANIDHELIETDLDEETSIYEQDDTEVELAEVTQPTNDNISTTSTNTEPRTQPHGGIGASQIVLLVLGIVLLVGLVRFIFDHYVR